jgi:transposase
MSTDATSLPDTSPHLPEDIAVCHRMIQELLARLHSQDHELEHVRHRLDQLLRRLYGPRAERYDPNQPVLFGELTAPPPPEPPPPPVEDLAAKRKEKKGHGRRRLPNDLRRETRTYELPEAERPCPGCGAPRTPFGQEISEQLDYLPASVFVIEHRRLKYACPNCHDHVATAPKPPQPIDKGLPGPGLLAHIITCKYADHLPLYRQERILGRHGIDLRRSTTCAWMAACAGLLRPLYERMTELALGSLRLYTDDSPLPVLDRDRRSTRRGHMWVFIGDDGHPYTVFDFAPNHCNDWPIRFLDRFHGYLQADAYKGYDALYAPRDGQVRIWEVGCWAHARRKFFEAGTSDTARSAEALARIGLLYQVERDAAAEIARGQLTGADADTLRLRLRQERALLLLTSLRQWLEEQQKEVLPKSPMGLAIAYVLNNWAAFERYTTAGFLDIDNNVAERTLRHFVIGRKNWLFAGSDQGGATAAVLFSFTVTCKRHGIDPFSYLRDVLTRLPTQPAERLDELLPDRWATARRAETEVAPAAAAPDSS